MINSFLVYCYLLGVLGSIDRRGRLCIFKSAIVHTHSTCRDEEMAVRQDVTSCFMCVDYLFHTKVPRWLKKRGADHCVPCWNWPCSFVLVCSGKVYKYGYHVDQKSCQGTLP
ncbi:hypothetical protein F4820DRAFT_415221 [Hypoxylon rubiginosum]|uniref:Uncharacterized protein n=1 Tax=Hypoxylon rubiginosum TaxID=110542 RepID=A0ACB9Z6E1_9PEZI|nr:hypothetical protein F4820DRAFT_415221 [Hypoxylon rubiginosum]